MCIAIVCGQSDSDDGSLTPTPKADAEGKTGADDGAEVAKASTSIEAREREEEMSYDDIGAGLSVDDNIKVITAVKMQETYNLGEPIVTFIVLLLLVSRNCSSTFPDIKRRRLSWIPF